MCMNATSACAQQIAELFPGSAPAQLSVTYAQVVARCDMATFAFLVRSLDAGLKSLDVSISSQCAAAVDNLAGFYFKGCAEEAPSPAAQVDKHHCKCNPTK